VLVVIYIIFYSTLGIEGKHETSISIGDGTAVHSSPKARQVQETAFLALLLSQCST
jgi:hypothetical protein